MLRQVIYTVEAAQDVEEAYAWYDGRIPGLGEEFLNCLGACVERIVRHPLSCPVVTDRFRRALIRRFPYEVFYESTEHAIVIYSVFHASQDPVKWRSRLPREE